MEAHFPLLEKTPSGSFKWLGALTMIAPLNGVAH
jgi:hypothetical protein